MYYGFKTQPKFVLRMTNRFNEKEWSLVQNWIEDSTFIHWAKQTNQEHIEKWENHLNNHPYEWELAKVAKSLILGIHFKEISENLTDNQRALKSMLSRIGKDDSSIKVRRSKIIKIRNYKRIAAVATFLLMITSLIYWQFIHNPIIILATDFGHQVEKVLPDGSTVILNANSKLTYKKQDSRNVTLEGEAYFNIKKIPETNAIFHVSTPDLSVKVLGTSFNVNTRNELTKIFLEEGKVRLDVNDARGENIEMNPGDFVSYSKKHDNLEKNLAAVSALQTASWKEGALIFKNTPLMEALFEIEDIYGIQFVIQTESLKKETISGGIPIMDLGVTLKTLTEIYGIRMKSTGKRYFIEGRD